MYIFKSKSILIIIIVVKIAQESIYSDVNGQIFTISTPLYKILNPPLCQWAWSYLVTSKIVQWSYVVM